MVFDSHHPRNSWILVCLHIVHVSKQSKTYHSINYYVVFSNLLILMLIFVLKTDLDLINWDMVTLSYTLNDTECYLLSSSHNLCWVCWSRRMILVVQLSSICLSVRNSDVEIFAVRWLGDVLSLFVRKCMCVCDSLRVIS